MVAKIESGKSIKGILHYNEHKVESGLAQLILASGFGMDVTALNLFQKLERFEYLTELNNASKTNAIHISLNFDTQDGVSNQKLQHIAAEYMEGIGFGDQPFLVYRHLDAAHPHMHIVTTNIQPDGKRIGIHNLGKTLSEQMRKFIEAKYNLVKAEGRQKSNALAITPPQSIAYGKAPTKARITGVVHSVLRHYMFTNFAEFNMVLKQFNVLALRGHEKSEMFRKNGLMYSIIDGAGAPVGVPIKASSIYGKPTMKTLSERYIPNLERRKRFKTPLTADIDGTFKNYHSITQDTFTEEMANKSVKTIFHNGSESEAYGLSFVDNNRKTVFSGSALGKSYTAKAISERFSLQDIPINDKARTFLRPPEKSSFTRNIASHEKFMTRLQRSLSDDHDKRVYYRDQLDYNPYLRRKRKKKKMEPSQEPEQSL